MPPRAPVRASQLSQSPHTLNGSQAELVSVGGVVSGVVVSEWRGYGKDLLYVNDAATGDKVAVFDRNTGRLNLIDENRESETVRALRPFLAGALAPAMAQR